MRIVGDGVYLRPIGGIEACVLEDSAALVARGHSFDLFFTLDGEQRASFERAGVRLHGPVPFKISIRRMLLDALKVVPAMRAVRRVKPDVVWLNRAEYVLWATLIARAARVPLVVHLHQAPHSRWVPWTNKGVARFIAVSQFTRSRWIAAGLPADRIEVVPNALPPGRYPAGGADEMRAARRGLGLPEEGRVLTFYGRFSEQKGLPTVIEAFRRLEREDVTLLLAGAYFDTEKPTEMRALVESVDPARVRVVPASMDVRPFLHAADVVLSASWVEEAFGRTVVETLSTGRPVIASASGAVPELLGGGMERMLVPPRDATAMRDAILALLDWRDDEPDLGERCTAWVDERFPYDRHLRDIEAVLTREATRRRSVARRASTLTAS
jgi:glycosyltransferase involved in cell wall biosynthesis